jgi:pilus assembly protein Flp/PilA
MKHLKEFACDESGASAVEYGMLVALIAAVIVTVVAALGQDMSRLSLTPQFAEPSTASPKV